MDVLEWLIALSRNRLDFRRNEWNRLVAKAEIRVVLGKFLSFGEEASHIASGAKLWMKVEKRKFHASEMIETFK